MAISVITNVSSLNAQRNLSKSGEGLATSMQRLSSGMRINSAKDDAAGLQISNRLTSQVNGLGVAQRNANDGISMSQTAEGAMSASTDILQRMRELALQSANGSNSDKDRAALQKEVTALQSELTRIAETTSFGGQKLLDGSFGTKAFQVGANANEIINVSMKSTAAADIGINSKSLEATVANVGFAAAIVSTGAGTLVASNVAGGTIGIDNNTASTIGASSTAKAAATAMNVSSGTTGVTAEASTEVKMSALGDPGTVSFALNGINVSAAITDKTDLSALATAINDKSTQTGVTATIDDAGKLSMVDSDGDDIEIVSFNNTGTTKTVSLEAVDADGDTNAAITVTAGAVSDTARITGAIKLTSEDAFSVTVSQATMGVSGTSALDKISTVDLTTASKSQDALAVIDGALSQIDSQRADLGAVQNRFGHTISNLSNIQENVSASRSRIQDTDFAVETANMTKNQILQQAGTSILAQANQLPQAALSLIG
ncbi:branched-chain alpha-keto acid dehydrogenase subunit E2 [Colwellia sp. PAMC 20917]|uniref:flagellin n=1 Tax=Colwellia sp. PAMC 20917 TaxID=1816218 RepID=UPI000878F6F5|nr:flagellin [Colwellia sp. PAMC 20917]AOW76557.1 branched-chain alpha-keto acid dehydrogenase subunit E2 [Colwellia sp. PAMC 20917]